MLTVGFILAKISLKWVSTSFLKGFPTEINVLFLFYKIIYGTIYYVWVIGYINAESINLYCF